MTKDYYLKFIQRHQRLLTILVLIPFLLSTFSFDASSRRRRSYKPEKTRQQAITIIRTNS